MTWWKVKPPIDSVFLILVAGGRIVTFTRSYGGLTLVGAKWSSARKALEANGFKCTMETP